ncbi:hypothetical protein NT6N_26880 [Oceaniferula spumae]|uniref:Glycosyltransferase 2-like domain-containing protein n=1 Tax=Oceaniferula spumae TaxID=2979115 RepID=A0AAT9FNX6_9BACT
MQLSIIIPVYNRHGLLREAIDSVIRQNLDSCEIIVCDDGSTDDVGKLCDTYSDANSHVSLSRTPKNYGAQVARNRGLNLARGQYVLFLDSDDVLADGGVASLLGAMVEDTSLDYVYGKVIRANHQLIPRDESPPVGEPFTDEPFDLAGYHWHTMGAMYKREYLQSVGEWNIEMTGSQDWEYQARVKLAGGKRKFVDSIVGYWRQHSISRIGTNQFRPDYVRSVMIACDVVLKLAREKNRCDRALENRLARRLVVHALEWGVNGHWKDRKLCLLQAKDSVSSNRMMKLGLRVMAYSPMFLDEFIMDLVNGN